MQAWDAGDGGGGDNARADIEEGTRGTEEEDEDDDGALAG